MATPVPKGVMGAGALTVLFAPTVADIDAITVTEATAPTVVDLSCLLTEAVDLGMDHEKVDTNRLCLENAIQNFGRVTFDPQPLITAYDPQNPASDVSKAYTALTSGLSGVLILRWGLKRDVAIAADQYYDAFEVTFGESSKVPPEEGAELTASIPWTVSGDYAKDEQFVAGP